MLFCAFSLFMLIMVVWLPNEKKTKNYFCTTFFIINFDLAPCYLKKSVISYIEKIYA